MRVRKIILININVVTAILLILMMVIDLAVHYDTKNRPWEGIINMIILSDDSGINDNCDMIDCSSNTEIILTYIAISFIDNG